MRFTQVDAFTSDAFAGNPAAVFVLPAPLADERMQLIAREMNLSETAFVSATGEREDDTPVFDLRWFTPTKEIDLCGHATLATAHVLWAEEHLDRDLPALFDTRSGRLACRTGDDGAVAMDFPANPPFDCPLPAPLEDVFPALAWFGRADGWYLARLADAQMIRDLAPDLASIMALDERGLIVTAPGDRDGVDAVSRVFVPQMGIPEDPVTGAAHCVIGPAWGGWLGVAEVRCHQASERGGDMVVRLRGERVELVGDAVTVLEGTLLV